MTWAVLGVTRGLLGVTGDDITGFMYIQVIRQAGGHLSRFAEFFTTRNNVPGQYYMCDVWIYLCNPFCSTQSQSFKRVTGGIGRYREWE